MKQRRVTRRKKNQWMMACLLLAMLVLSSFFNSTEQKAEKSTNEIASDSLLKVYFLDVGQADCILIENNEQYMLVDGGNNEDEEFILDYLNELGVKQLEYVIGTHPHEDHIGSLDAVIRNYGINRVILPEKEHTTKTFEDLLDAVEEKNLKITKAKPGSKYMLGEAEFTIIAPNANYGDDLNNWSVGIKLTHGENAFVMCGDAEKNAEEDMLGTGIDLSADVLKLGHHGSSTSSSEEFVRAVHPSYAVISCGKDNTYGHPHQEVLDRMKELGIQVIRTDEQGTIIASSDGMSITWNHDT